MRRTALALVVLLVTSACTPWITHAVSGRGPATTAAQRVTWQDHDEGPARTPRVVIPTDDVIRPNANGVAFSVSGRAAGTDRSAPYRLAATDLDGDDWVNARWTSVTGEAYSSSVFVTPDRFETRPPGAALPSGAECAARVDDAPETRPGNATANATRGTDPNDRYPRVDGNFTGTTDEIIQWAACKWGIDEDVARAQAAKESWWHQSTGGDRTWDQSACHPQLRTAAGTQCPESTGLLQVRYLYHLEAFEDANAIRSTAYNADYTWAVWRACYDGELTWLNTVERGATYGPGDQWGCLGVWFSGRWRTQPALDYIAGVQDYLNQRVWAQSWF